MLLFLEQYFFRIPGSVPAAVNCIEKLSANGLSKFFITSKPSFINGPKSLLRNPPDYVILDSWLSDNFISADELFAKVLRSYETCLSVSDN